MIKTMEVKQIEFETKSVNSNKLITEIDKKLKEMSKLKSKTVGKTSYSFVLQNGLENIAITKKLVSQIEEINTKKCNLVFSGGDFNASMDVEITIKEMISKIDSNIKVVGIKQLSNKKNNQVNILDKVIVSFENQTNRDDMMKKFISFSKSLNQLDRKFFVSPDLTTQEQKFAK